jgi:hypothetical protein
MADAAGAPPAAQPATVTWKQLPVAENAWRHTRRALNRAVMPPYGTPRCFHEVHADADESRRRRIPPSQP